MDAETRAVQERYARFARVEAAGRSDVYGRWAAAVSADADAAATLARVAAARRQPPLVFAVARLLGAAEATGEEFVAWIAGNADALVAEAGRRSLQTNEPLRCAALLPALAAIDGPVALLEIGASAGLCLYPDRYSYRYEGGPDLDPADGASPVVLRSALDGDAPRLRLPEVVWRAGIDLAPLDAAAAADRRFLTTLVWPGEAGRAERIEHALDIVAADPPLLSAGDATEPDVLRAVAAQAPDGATLVITTPGVMPHIPRAGRERLVATLRELDAAWITIDPAGLHDAGGPPAARDGFILGRDGIPLAAVDPLGAWVRWNG